MLAIKITIEDENNPCPSFTTRKYMAGINEKNYEEEILKLLFWLKENKEKQIIELQYMNENE